MHRRLGCHIRRAIPACVVIAIRNKFPDEHGNYVGFWEWEVEDDDAAETIVYCYISADFSAVFFSQTGACLCTVSMC